MNRLSSAYAGDHACVPELMSGGEAEHGTSACRHGFRHGGMHDCRCEFCSRWICYASADFAHRRMTQRSLDLLSPERLPAAQGSGRRGFAQAGVGGYGFWRPRAFPWSSISEMLEKQSVTDCHCVKCYRCPKLAISCLFVISSLCS